MCTVNILTVKDPLHNSCESVAAGSGWAARRLFAVNSPAIDKKNNAADRPRPVDHSPQGVMQRVLKLNRCQKVSISAKRPVT